MRGLEQSRPVLAAAPGAALAVPFTTRMQVSSLVQQMRRLSKICHHCCAAFPHCTAGPQHSTATGEVHFFLAMLLAGHLGRGVRLHERCAAQH